MNYYTLSKKPKILMKSNAEGNTSVQCYDLLASKNTDINLANLNPAFLKSNSNFPFTTLFVVIIYLSFNY